MSVDTSTAQEILDGAEIGKRIAVIVPSLWHGHNLILDLLGLIDLPLSEYKVYRSRLEIRIKNGGRITVHSIRSSSGLRGMTLDRIYLEEEVTDDRILENIIPCLAVTGGVIVRY